MQKAKKEDTEPTIDDVLEQVRNAELEKRLSEPREIDYGETNKEALCPIHEVVATIYKARYPEIPFDFSKESPFRDWRFVYYKQANKPVEDSLDGMVLLDKKENAIKPYSDEWRLFTNTRALIDRITRKLYPPYTIENVSPTKGADRLVSIEDVRPNLDDISKDELIEHIKVYSIEGAFTNNDVILKYDPFDWQYKGLFYLRDKVNELAAEIVREREGELSNGVKDEQTAGNRVSEKNRRGKKDRGKAIEAAYKVLKGKTFKHGEKPLAYAKWICENVAEFKTRFEELNGRGDRFALQKALARDGEDRREEWRRFRGQISDFERKQSTLSED